MLKKIGLGALLFVSATANAGIIRDVVNQVDALGWGDEIFRIHDLRTDVVEGNEFVVGGPELIVSGTFTLNFMDDSFQEGDQANLAFFDFSLDGTDGGTLFFAGDITTRPIAADVLLTLNTQGMVEVKIWSEMGDFKVLDTEVRVNTRSVTASVPEPGVLTLLGLGVIGLRLARSRT